MKRVKQDRELIDLLVQVAPTPGPQSEPALRAIERAVQGRLDEDRGLTRLVHRP